MNKLISKQINKNTKCNNSDGIGPYLDTLSKNIDYVHVGNTRPDWVATFPSDHSSVAQDGWLNTSSILIAGKSQCDGSTGTKEASVRTFAVVIQLESGGKGKYYCQDAS